MKARHKSSLATGVISLLCMVQLEGATFIPLPYLLGTDYSSSANGISDDAAYVGGASGGKAVRWTVGGSVLSLGSSVSTFAMSADGQVLVGYNGTRAFRWSPGTGMRYLAALPGKTYHVAWGVSGDGSVVVGSGDVGSTEQYAEPFKWTSTTGTVSLGFLEGASRGEALAISRDGSVIVGYCGSTQLNIPVQAFQRGPDGVMTGLGFLPGYSESVARGVSTNGAVIVGECNDSWTNSQAFRWTAAGGMTGLGLLPGYSRSSAEAVSGDGLIVVGSCGYAKAFIWDTNHGMRDLQAVLAGEFGLPLAGWTLTSANAISGDGKAIVGNGTNPQGNGQAWLAVLTKSLSIKVSNSSAVLSWPIAFSNYVPQARSSFAPSAIWSTITNAPVRISSELIVTNAATGNERYFRLAPT
jgi:probable HAF family extracellular repeat protein